MEVFGRHFSTPEVMSVALMGAGWVWLVLILAKRSVLQALGGALFLPGLLVFGMLNLTVCRWPLVMWLVGLGLSYAAAPPDFGSGLAILLGG